MDMMDADPSNSTSTTTSISGVFAGQFDAARDLLTSARQLIDQGKPAQALQAIVMAVRCKGGEEAVAQISQRACELYTRNLQASSEADELASLLAECAITEPEPARANLCPVSAQAPVPHTSYGNSDANRTPILTESGRKQIILDAFSDGSSFICLKCGGLVSVNRKDEHFDFWCLL